MARHLIDQIDVRTLRIQKSDVRKVTCARQDGTIWGGVGNAAEGAKMFAEGKQKGSPAAGWKILSVWGKNAQKIAENTSQFSKFPPAAPTEIDYNVQ